MLLLLLLFSPRMQSPCCRMESPMSPSRKTLPHSDNTLKTNFCRKASNIIQGMYILVPPIPAKYAETTTSKPLISLFIFFFPECKVFATEDEAQLLPGCAQKIQYRQTFLGWKNHNKLMYILKCVLCLFLSKFIKLCNVLYTFK